MHGCETEWSDPVMLAVAPTGFAAAAKALWLGGTGSRQGPTCECADDSPSPCPQPSPCPPRACSPGSFPRCVRVRVQQRRSISLPADG